MKNRNIAPLLPVLALGLTGSIVPALAQEPDTLTYVNILRLKNNAAQGDLAPIVRIISPLADASIAPGESRIGNGKINGTGFLVNVEVVTRDGVPATAREATMAPPVFGIRHVDLLQKGAINPDVPGLYVFFDTDLITPDGTVLPKFSNFANAFNVAGSDDTPGLGNTLWLGWHVLESLPPNVNQFTLTVAFVDNQHRIGLDRVKVHVDRSKTSGNGLTPDPGTFLFANGGQDDPDGPEVSLIAPRVPTSIALGPQPDSPIALNPNNGSLMFIQVTALDRSGAGIAVDETGAAAGNPFPLGLIFDPTRIPSAANGFVGGPNRNYPGLSVTFDVPLKQPNGNIVPAGMNLAPLFDVAGSELDVTGAVRTTADWVVGGSLLPPPGKTSVTITARVTDNLGRSRATHSTLSISPTVSGQDLTLTP